MRFDEKRPSSRFYSPINFFAPSMTRSHWKAGPGSILLVWTW